ncbi:LOW QUALITY PROTEIN: signal-regulatory protein beta-2-like [Poeciliopsis prolifica]|uniref:LOW QUALITY PROTEIN: signal-regulatory protein beta-2-like n=1 Tax=Poeciliopsis prolifica TaxID=188132 RepID=UPI002413FD01|nr:LOW QUALITY PROTEIN: signal-regulatory protein beta-2-like [Poeciliopsis prolifica]
MAHIVTSSSNTLVPVVTVELGQSVTLSCDFAMKYQSNTWLYWYKQSAGDTLTLIAMQQTSVSPKYGPAISSSKFNVRSNEHSSNLTIFTTVYEDEGMYHCAQIDRLKSTWNGTYISVKGVPNRTSNYTVVQQTTISGPTRPTGSETLQCSVLSDSEITNCSGEPSVFWFRARSEKSFPDMIYTDGKRSENCEKSSNSPKQCFYNFHKNISSSDAGTFYCAVATCGQIIFGNEIKGGERDENIMLMVTIAAIICLVISVIFNIVFICFRTQRSACQRFKESSSSETRSNFSRIANDNEAGPDLNYAALHFSEGRTSREKKKRELMTEESVYSQVKG